MRSLNRACIVACLWGGLVLGAEAEVTALDHIATSYDVSGSVLLLGMTGNNRVSLRLYSGVGASEAGERATLGGGAVAYSTGGCLQYTLYSQATSKITVETATANYLDSALAVTIVAIGAGGGGNAGNVQGSASSPGRLGYVPIKATALDLITGISGTDTWTGTGRNDGASVRYRLNAQPGNVGGSIVVLFTVVNL